MKTVRASTQMIAFRIILLALLGVPCLLSLASQPSASFYNAEIDSAAIFVELYRVASNPTLIAIPLFTSPDLFSLMENPERLARVSQTILKGVPGGIPLAILMACAFFTALTGASGVTIIALGGLFYPLLLREKYGESFSLGMITSSGSSGAFIPPFPATYFIWPGRSGQYRQAIHCRHCPRPDHDYDRISLRHHSKYPVIREL